ncbi:MAG: hypothetical protein H8E31_00480 [Planctomycetes bacterium]|nr:hypothetical protein [Planctomycetota bacterium]
MSLRLGAAYRNRDPVVVERAWRRRLVQLKEHQLVVEVVPEKDGLVRAQVRARAGERIPFRRFGALLRLALGPEREELAEFWLIRPGNAGPGPLRLEGADWGECLAAVEEPAVSQLRFFSPMLCPGAERLRLMQIGQQRHLELAQASGWVLVRRHVARSKPPPPPPWRGNYGW